MKEGFMLLQADRSYDYNCTILRGMSASYSIIIELKLEYLVLIKNASSNSICDLVERKIGAINFGLWILAYNWEESTIKVETAIKIALVLKNLQININLMKI